MTDTKRCLNGVSCCHPNNIDGWLNTSEFYFRKDRNKYRNSCRACILNDMAIKYRNNPEKKKEYQRGKLREQIQKRLNRILKALIS